MTEHGSHATLSVNELIMRKDEYIGRVALIGSPPTLTGARVDDICLRDRDMMLVVTLSPVPVEERAASIKALGTYFVEWRALEEWKCPVVLVEKITDSSGGLNVYPSGSLEPIFFSTAKVRK